MISLASRSGPSKQRAATPPPPSGYHYVGEKPENYSSIRIRKPRDSMEDTYVDCFSLVPNPEKPNLVQSKCLIPGCGRGCHRSVMATQAI